jgi:16S rRNA G966 N2-methylase RsmD
MKIDLWQGDCLSEMSKLPDQSVDMVLCDPPYGTAGGMGSGEARYARLAAAASWDTPINTSLLLGTYERILRMNGAMLMFAQEPYTSQIIVSCPANLPFSYRLLWLKDHFANSLLVNKAPVSYFEDVIVAFKKYDTCNLHPLREYARKVLTHIGIPIKEICKKLGHRRAEHFFYITSSQFGLCTRGVYEQMVDTFNLQTLPWFLDYMELQTIHARYTRVFNLPPGKKFFSNVLDFHKDRTGLHPTQKPVAMMEYLIRTYTNAGMTVLDNCMGSGTTGVACINTGRNFIGIEKDAGYFEIAKNRIETARAKDWLEEI